MEEADESTVSIDRYWLHSPGVMTGAAGGWREVDRQYFYRPKDARVEWSLEAVLRDGGLEDLLTRGQWSVAERVGSGELAVVCKSPPYGGKTRILVPGAPPRIESVDCTTVSAIVDDPTTGPTVLVAIRYIDVYGSKDCSGPITGLVDTGEQVRIVEWAGRHCRTTVGWVEFLTSDGVMSLHSPAAPRQAGVVTRSPAIMTLDEGEPMRQAEPAVPCPPIHDTPVPKPYHVQLAAGVSGDRIRCEWSLVADASHVVAWKNRWTGEICSSLNELVTRGAWRIAAFKSVNGRPNVAVDICEDPGVDDLDNKVGIANGTLFIIQSSHSVGGTEWARILISPTQPASTQLDSKVSNYWRWMRVDQSAFCLEAVTPTTTPALWRVQFGMDASLTIRSKVNVIEVEGVRCFVRHSDGAEWYPLFDQVGTPLFRAAPSPVVQPTIGDVSDPMPAPIEPVRHPVPTIHRTVLPIRDEPGSGKPDARTDWLTRRSAGTKASDWVMADNARMYRNRWTDETLASRPSDRMYPISVEACVVLPGLKGGALLGRPDLSSAVSGAIKRVFLSHTEDMELLVDRIDVRLGVDPARNFAHTHASMLIRTNRVTDEGLVDVVQTVLSQPDFRRDLMGSLHQVPGLHHLFHHPACFGLDPVGLLSVITTALPELTDAFREEPSPSGADVDKYISAIRTGCDLTKAGSVVVLSKQCARDQVWAAVFASLESRLSKYESLHHVTSLYLWDCGIGDSGAAALVTLISTSLNSLSVLVLDDNMITAVSGKPLLQSVSTHLSRLMRLSISGNPIGDDAVAVLFNAASQCSFESIAFLGLSECGLTPAYVGYLRIIPHTFTVAL